MTVIKPLTPLVGRERERAVLADAGDVAVFLRGEPGIGKTRLLAEASATSNRRTFFARCHRASTSIAEPLAAALRTDLPDDERDRLPTLRDAVARAAADAPIVIQLDDVHLLSARSLDELVLCIDRLQDSDVRWQLTLRPEAHTVEAIAALRSTGLARVLDLAPLDRDDASVVVARVVGPLASEESERLYRRSGGNPFYLEQLANARAAARPIPSDLQTLLRNRIGALTPADREVAEALAIASAALDPTTLATALGRTSHTIAQRLSDLTAAGIVRPVDDRFEFVHDVLREVCAADVAADQALELHAAYARTAKSPPERAVHLACAGRLRESALVSIELADAALVARSIKSAREHLTRARDVALNDDDIVWYLGMGDAIFAAADGELERAAGMLREILPAPDAVDGPARARWLTSAIRVAQDPRAPNNTVAVESALTDPQIPPALTLPMRFTRVTAYYNDGRLAEARSEIARALAIDGGDENVRFELRCVGAMLGEFDHPERARADLEALAADPAAHALTSYPTVFRCLAHTANIAENMTEQRRYAKEALDAVRDTFVPITGPLTLLAEATLSLGEPLAALDACNAVYARNARVGVAGFFKTQMVELEANAWLSRFEDVDRVLGAFDASALSSLEMAEFYSVHGAIEELRGRDARAVAAYERTTRREESFFAERVVGALVALVRLAAVGGDRAGARHAWERLQALPPDKPRSRRSIAEARMYLALAEDADGEELGRRLAGVAAIDRDLLWTARARVHVAERTRDREGFRAAIETFERAEAREMAAAARKRANALGFRFAGTLAEREVLTPRELNAARLVAQGKTNKEISTILSVSPKTVAHHVAAILAKTGMRSRVEIAAHVAAGKPFASAPL